MRVLVVLGSYLLSCLVAALILSTAFALSSMNQAWHSGGHNNLGMLGGIAMLALSLWPFAVLASCPALIAISIYEFKKERRWSPYAVFGASLSAVISVVFVGFAARPGLHDLLVIAGFAVLGLVAATVYWLIACRILSAPAS